MGPNRLIFPEQKRSAFLKPCVCLRCARCLEHARNIVELRHLKKEDVARAARRLRRAVRILDLAAH